MEERRFSAASIVAKTWGFSPRGHSSEQSNARTSNSSYRARFHRQRSWPAENYFLYQKIANATSATVMIHNTMSLLRFFSSAIGSSTAHLHSRFKSRDESPPPTGTSRLPCHPQNTD